MPRYIVEALSQYRMVYYVECDSQEQAEDAVWSNDVLDEFGQHHLGEIVVSSREVDSKEVVKVFNELNGYLADRFTEDQKSEFNLFIVKKETASDGI